MSSAKISNFFEPSEATNVGNDEQRAIWGAIERLIDKVGSLL